MNKTINQKPSKKIYKQPYFLPVVIVIVVLALMGIMTRVGAIPNYLRLEFLSPETDDGIIIDFPYDNHSAPIAKPIIYLYPQQKQQINVKLNFQGQFTVTYPQYNNGWEVTAFPDGKIINIADSKEYSYLFWEGISNNASYNLTTGFVVKGSDTVSFLQQSLSTLGLTAKEYNEFIVYWLPQMMNNDYNLIHFASKEEYNDKAVLEITPTPDSILRVFMVFQKLDKDNQNIIPQKLQPFARQGFSVIEWGGTEIK